MAGGEVLLMCGNTCLAVPHPKLQSNSKYLPLTRAHPVRSQLPALCFSAHYGVRLRVQSFQMTNTPGAPGARGASWQWASCRSPPGSSLSPYNSPALPRCLLLVGVPAGARPAKPSWERLKELLNFL